MSHSIASSQPPPSAKPATAATTGLRARATRCQLAVNSRMVTSLNDWLTISLMSAPAANAFSEPVRQHAADAVVGLELVDRLCRAPGRAAS